MEKASLSAFCSVCKTKLKRQVLGSNIFYYCRNCGSLISEIYVSDEINFLHVQKSPSVQRAIIEN